MMLQLLIPAVKDAEKANLGSEAPGICGNFHQRLRTAAEQQPIHHLFVLQCQGRQLMGKREYDMSVGRRKQFGAPRRQPAVARLALALRAVPVPAGVIRDGSMAAG